jgi:hypothetical protein
MFCNLVVVEQFIAIAEKEANRRFLQRIDIPLAERPTAIRELATMGITAASLFPGLDGVCGALAESFPPLPN